MSLLSSVNVVVVVFVNGNWNEFTLTFAQHDISTWSNSIVMAIENIDKRQPESSDETSNVIRKLAACDTHFDLVWQMGVHIAHIAIPRWRIKFQHGCCVIWSGCWHNFGRPKHLFFAGECVCLFFFSFFVRWVWVCAENRTFSFGWMHFICAKDSPIRHNCPNAMRRRWRMRKISLTISKVTHTHIFPQASMPRLCIEVEVADSAESTDSAYIRNAAFGTDGDWSVVCVCMYLFVLSCYKLQHAWRS